MLAVAKGDVPTTGATEKQKLFEAMTAPEGQIDNFVVIHIQALALTCEGEARFAHLPSYECSLVGSRDGPRLRGPDNVTLARELPDNLQAYPDLLSFTG